LLNPVSDVAEHFFTLTTRAKGMEHVSAAGNLGDRPLIVLASAQAATAARTDLQTKEIQLELGCCGGPHHSGGYVIAVREVVSATATQQ